MSTLAAENLSCGYDGRPVISDVSLSVRAGGILALIGPNGAGKTTLLRAMCRLIKPASGKVLLNGQDIWRLHAREVARRIARVAQSNRLAWPFTVHQAVSLGRFPHRGWVRAYTTEDHGAVEEALRKTGLWDYRERTLNTLSGGEVQRSWIAGALAQTPSILLLDEPVAHLDIKYQIAILDLIRDLARQGLAVVVSLHDLNLASLYADSVALLYQGRLFALGEPTSILTKERLEAVYETEVVINRHPLNHRLQITPVPSWLKGTPR